MQFRAEASVGNGEGVFDAAYDFGDGKAEAEMVGMPEQIGAAGARYLESVRPENCRAMQYGTGEFFILLRISRVDSGAASKGRS